MEEREKQKRTQQSGFIDVLHHFPPDFFDKRVNEPFVQELMNQTLSMGPWRRGDPNAYEPDYFCGPLPFEITLVSDSKKKDSFIERFKSRHYMPDEAEEELFLFMVSRIEDKAKKTYSVHPVHLCLLLVKDMFHWVADAYGSTVTPQLNARRDQWFTKIRRSYIDKGIFANIYILFPDVCASWWVQDLCTMERHEVKMDIRDKSRPFVVTWALYEQYQQQGRRGDLP